MDLIGFIILIAPILIGLIVALYVGLQALRYKPEYKSTQGALRWIALNLCEPFVNFILIGLMTHISLQQSGVNRYSDDVLLHTLPMIILLLPAKDLLAENPVQRRIAAQALALGIVRWLTTMAIHLSMSAGNSSSSNNPFFLLLAVGIFLLWGSALWGRIQLTQIMNNEADAVRRAHA